MKALFTTFATCLAALAMATPASADHHGDHSGDHSGPSKAVCVLLPTIGSQVTGVIVFEETEGTVTITGTVVNLTPGKHGFHIHEYGDISDLKTGKSTGGHFNPGGHEHGEPSDGEGERHVGDLGNIEANEQGIATVNITDSLVDLHGENSILGRGVVVHAEEDKFTQPTGDAGGRVAIGTIGIAKGEMPKMEMKEAMKEATDEKTAMEKMKENASDAKEKAEAAAENAEEAVEESAEKMKEEVAEEAAELKADAKDAAAKAEKGARDAAAEAATEVKEAAAKVEEEAAKAAEDAKD